MPIQITGGRVTFERTVRPADFESKKAIVELSFSNEDNQSIQEVLDVVGSMARNKALELVDLAPRATGAAGTTTKPAEAKTTTAAPKKDAATVVDEPASTKGKTKADLEKEQATALAKSKDAKTTKPAKPPAAKKDAAEVVDEVPVNGNISTGGERVNPDEVVDENLFAATGDDEATVEAITDEQLMSKITRHNAKINNPTAIRQLIGTFFPAGERNGKQARDLPADKRAEFIEKLEKL